MSSGKAKGFVFSLDAVFALIIVIALIGFALVVSFDKSPSTFSRTNLSQLSDDAITALDNAGFFANEIDANGFSSATALSMYNKIKSLYPGNVDLNLVLKEYTYDIAACKGTESFEDCFKDINTLSLSVGLSLPANKEIVHGKKVFSKKQPPGQCALSLSQEDPRKLKKKPSGPLFFDDEDDQILEGIEVDFNVVVVPSDQITCDENISITLNVGINTILRKPIDVVMVLDKSSSMDDCVVSDGNIFLQQSGTIGGGTIVFGNRVGWVEIASFSLAQKRDFQVTAYNNVPCTTNCPELYLQRPSGQQYGFYGGAPPNGCYYSIERINSIMIPEPNAQIGLWRIFAWNDNPLMDYNLFAKFVPGKKTKLDEVKSASHYFINNALWLPVDQYGMVSFAQNANLHSPLNQSQGAINNAIDSLSASTQDSSVMGDAIEEATSEHNSPRANPEAFSVQVLLSDGGTTGGVPSATAAINAAADGIRIYAVGFGEDADVAELTNIATITGGEFYYADDENSLKDIFDLIANEIGAEATDVNIVVPVQLGSAIIDLGGGSMIDGNLLFDLNDVVVGTEWNATYVINFPCDGLNSCSFSALTFPGPGTRLTYTDSNGVHVIDWNVFVTIPYRFRDLTVNYLSGIVLSQNSVSLDVNAANIGDLNSGATNVRFYLNDPDAGGSFLDQLPIAPLCGGRDPLCVSSFQIFNDTLSTQGTIFVTINDDNAVRECPGNNKDLIYCYLEPATQFYSVDYYAWWK